MSLNLPQPHFGTATFYIPTASADHRTRAVRNAIHHGLSLVGFEPLATVLTGCRLQPKRVQFQSPITPQTRVAFMASSQITPQPNPVATLCCRRLLVTPQGRLLLVYTLHNVRGRRLTTVHDHSRVSELENRDMMHVLGDNEGNSGALLTEGVLAFFRECATREFAKGANIMAAAQQKLLAIPTPVR